MLELLGFRGLLSQNATVMTRIDCRDSCFAKTIPALRAPSFLNTGLRMKLLRVASAALNQTPLAWESNLRNIQIAIEQARKAEASVLCLPELCLTGYGCEDAFHSPGVLETALEMLARVVPLTEGMAVSVGLPLMYGGAVFNAACLIVNGQIAGFVAKQHLAGDGIHYEPRWFKPWPEGIHGVLEVAGEVATDWRYLF